MDLHKEDKVVLLQLFPLEIWLNIFHHLDLPDIKDTRCASPAFAKLLNPLRSKHLFPEVLKILLPYFPKDSDTFDGNKIFLQCRQVCRFWKTGVDQVFQDPQYHTRLEGGPLILDVVNRIRLETNISETGGTNNEKTPQQFENKFLTSHLTNGTNPFISRCLNVRIPCPRNRNEVYYTQLEEMLRKCGHHVWYFSLLLDDFAPCENYPQVRALLELLPNLRWLFVDHKNELRTIEELHQVEPFPTYSNLEYLYVVDDHGQFFEAFLENNRHVKVLEIEYRSFSNGSFLVEEDMPKLEQLKIEFDDSVDLEQFQNAHLTWPLKTLALDIMSADWAVNGRLFQIFEQKFSSTLCELKLDFPSEVRDITKVHSLCFLNLKSLTLNIYYSIPLSFILPMKDNLEYLSVEMIKGISVSTVDFQEPVIRTIFFIETDTTKLNMWQIFPKLKEVKYGCWRIGEETTWNTYKKVGPNKFLGSHAL